MIKLDKLKPGSKLTVKEVNSWLKLSFPDIKIGDTVVIKHMFSSTTVILEGDSEDYFHSINDFNHTFVSDVFDVL